MISKYEIVDMLGRTFSLCELHNISYHLARGCEYESEYAGVKLKYADSILEHMRRVIGSLTYEQRYTYEIVLLDDLLREKKSGDLDTPDGTQICPHGLLLYHAGIKYPVAVVVVSFDADNFIGKICLSRSNALFDVDFYMMELHGDSPCDLPSTVLSSEEQDHQGRELYVWRKADKSVRAVLEKYGYSVLGSQTFDDCIGYRCVRNGCAYTVYMFACGNDETVRLDGEYCKKLLYEEYSADSIVLVAHLKVCRFRSGSEINYTVSRYNKANGDPPGFRRIIEVGSKPILMSYPCKEIIDAIPRFMYAFNHDCLDAYDCITGSRSPFLWGVSTPESGVGGSGFYEELSSLHRKYGDMKYGYVRYDDISYSAAPYLEGLGFFSLKLEKDTARIIDVTAHLFYGGNRADIADFIKADEFDGGAPFGDFPKLVKAEALPSKTSERFALRLIFDNGETKKYILPIDAEDEHKEVVSCAMHVFTDMIWESARVADHRKPETLGYPERGAAVEFKNGFFLSGFECYQESEEYTEP